MRYERAKDVVRLAMRLQGSRGGMTLDDVRTEFSISRRTAERLRDAVDEAFGPLIPVEDRDEKETALAVAITRLAAFRLRVGRGVDGTLSPRPRHWSAQA